MVVLVFYERCNLNGKYWFASQFPEAVFPCHESLIEGYRQRVIDGIDIMASSRVSIVTNISHCVNPEVHISRIEKLGELFQDYRVDVLVKHLTDRVKKLSEHNYRISYLFDYNFDYEYEINIDGELNGGFSYEGVANSFGWTELWDRIGSNGLWFHPDADCKRKFFDYSNYRRLGHWEPHNRQEIEALVYERGEPPIRVYACHGGLSISKESASQYTQRELHEHGKTTWLNPSMITLYSETLYKIP